MREETVFHTQNEGDVNLEIYYTEYHEESPNMVYGIWKIADKHIAGTTVAYHDRDGVTYWISCNYTPAQLAKDYAEQGRENPSKEAYDSLQKELAEELEGYTLGISYRVSKAGVTLVDNHEISTPYHPDWDLDDILKDVREAHCEPDRYFMEAQVVLNELCGVTP